RCSFGVSTGATRHQTRDERADRSEDLSLRPPSANGCSLFVVRRGSHYAAGVTANVYVYDGDGVRRIVAPAERPLRWAAWRPDGAWAMLVGNRGQALRFDGDRFEPLATRTAHNLRGVAWTPDGERALLVGNRGALLVYDGERFDE